MQSCVALRPCLFKSLVFFMWTEQAKKRESFNTAYYKIRSYVHKFWKWNKVYVSAIQTNFLCFLQQFLAYLLLNQRMVLFRPCFLRIHISSKLLSHVTPDILWSGTQLAHVWQPICGLELYHFVKVRQLKNQEKRSFVNWNLIGKMKLFLLFVV